MSSCASSFAAPIAWEYRPSVVVTFAWRKKLLNRLYVFAPADQKRGEGMTKIVESEPLTSLQSDSGLNGGGANLVRCHDARAQRRLTLQLHGREYPILRFRIERVNNGQETPYRSPYR